MMKIFIIEDNPGDLYLTRRSIQNHTQSPNLIIKDVDNGEDAIAFINPAVDYPGSFVPDLIFLDWNLPKVHGSEVLEFIKSHSDLKCIPTLVLSTSNNEDDVTKSYKSRANAYFKKPDDYHEFDNLMKTIINFWSLAAKSQSTLISSRFNAFTG